jgi:hypothetical protein
METLLFQISNLRFVAADYTTTNIVTFSEIIYVKEFVTILRLSEKRRPV